MYGAVTQQSPYEYKIDWHPGDYTGLQLCIFYKKLSDFIVQDHHCSGHCRPSAHSYTVKHLGLQ